MNAGVDDPLTLSLTALRAALAAGRFDPVDVARAVVERAKALSHLNAFITAPGEALLAAAAAADRASPLAGVPIAVKDNIDTADAITTAGAPGLIDWRPQRDADVVVKLRRAGGLVAGKANMHELAGGMTSANATFGAVANPYARQAHSGGSSGGSAAAVAARIVPAALGSDTGGSVLNPAAMCGIWGLRPTVGRVSQRGVVPLSHSRDTVGWLARAPEDLILMDQIHADVAAGHITPEEGAAKIKNLTRPLGEANTVESIRQKIAANPSKDPLDTLNPGEAKVYDDYLKADPMARLLSAAMAGTLGKPAVPANATPVPPRPDPLGFGGR